MPIYHNLSFGIYKSLWYTAILLFEQIYYLYNVKYIKTIFWNSIENISLVLNLLLDLGIHYRL